MRSTRAMCCGSAPSSRSASFPTRASAARSSTTSSRTSCASARAGPSMPTRSTRLLAIGRAAFAELADFPEVIAALVAALREDRALVRRDGSGVRRRRRRAPRRGNGEMPVTPAFTLTARADRLDVLTRRQRSPSSTTRPARRPRRRRCARFRRSFRSKALIARAGGFEGLPPIEPSRIVYYRLSGRGDKDERARSHRVGRTTATVTLAETLATTEERLAALVAHFARARRRLSLQQGPEAAPHLRRRLRPPRAHLRMDRDRPGGRG